MVRKVELDLLELDNLQNPEGPQKEGEPEENRRGWRRFTWLTRKKIIIAAILFTFSGIVGVSLLLSPGKKASHVDYSTELAEIKPLYENSEILDNFTIDLRDDNGQYRVLVCDIAIVLNPDKKISENKLEVRKKAYNALKNKGKYILTSSKAYRTIKKEMRDELDGLLGGGVKEVYFTKFILL
ncbi:MAG: flagellar basal body-associated FliL family protein [Syntrophaceae bacterium]